MTDAGATETSNDPIRPATPWWRRAPIMALGLVLLVSLVYANAVSHPFLYDDAKLVLGNPQIRSMSSLPEIVGFTDDGFVFKKRWTREAAYAIQYALAGPDPAVFHATNIALHAGVALLLFLLVGRLCRDARVGWWAAALFAVHPIHTEVVAHVSGLRGLLASVFALSALLLFESYTRRRGVWRLVAAFLLVYLGAFSKEFAALTPLGFVLIDLFSRLREHEGQPWGTVVAARLRERAGMYGALLVCTLALTGVILFGSVKSVGFQGSPSFYETSGDGLGPVARASLLGLGARLLVVPVGLSVDYSFDALGLAQVAWPPMRFVDLSLLVIVAALGIWGLVRRRWIGLAVAWFLLFMAPTSGIISWHEIFAERFLYLPSIGFFLAVAALGVGLASRGPARSRQMVVVGLALVLALGAATRLRNEAWSGNVALWKAAVERYPEAARAHKALGNAYLKDARPTEALEHFETAARLLPSFTDAHVGIAVAQTAQMQLVPAMQTTERILEKWPEEVKAWNLKGYLYQTMGNQEKALEAYERAVEVDPAFADGYNNLARIYVELGDVERAVEMYETAIEYDPSLVVAWKNLAIVYREAYGDEEKAAFYQQRANLLEAAR